MTRPPTPEEQRELERRAALVALPPQPPEAREELVVFPWGPHRLALRVDELEAIQRCDGMWPDPRGGARLGLAGFRGALCAVVDPTGTLGARPGHRPAWLVVTRAHGGELALPADAPGDALTLPRDQLSPPILDLAEAPVRALGPEGLLVLSLEHLEALAASCSPSPDHPGRTR